jgi:OOP family OmpA-OmpF porin
MKRVAKTVGALGLLGCVAVLNGPYAQAADSGWYGGLNIGQSRAHIDDARITSGLLGSGFTTTSITDDDHDTAYKIFGGFKINKNFALEGGYFDLGKFGFTSTTVPAGSLSGDMKIKGLNIDAVGFLPLSEKFSLFGRIGLQYAQVKDSFSGTGAVTPANSSASKSAGNLKAGAGIQYDFTPSLAMRGEWERYRIDDAVGNRGEVEMFSLGLVYMFGK